MATNRMPPYSNAHKKDKNEKSNAKRLKRRLRWGKNEQGKQGPYVAAYGSGVWTASVYESYCEYELDADIWFGVDIKLKFDPNPDLEPTNSILLVQFKNPIIKDRGMTREGWAVDRGSRDIYPYFGWENTNKPRTVIPVRSMLQALNKEDMAKRGKVMKRGSISKQYAASNKVDHAFVIDTPREFCKVTQLDHWGTKTAQFTTYAYDEQNQKWLSGVSWGYKVSNQDNNGFKLSTLGLGIRSRDELKEEEVNTGSAWMHKPPLVASLSMAWRSREWNRTTGTTTTGTMMTKAMTTWITMEMMNVGRMTTKASD